MKTQILFLISLFAYICSIQAQEILPDDTKQKISQSYSWMVGIMTMDKSSKLGFTTGLVANYRFNSKIGLETGLQYMRMQYSHVKDKQRLLYFGPDTTYAVPSPADLKLTRTWTAHYLELPILFTYQPHRKVQLHAGIKTSYLIGESYRKYYNYEVDSDLTTPSEINEEFYGANIWNISILTGIRYYPIKRLSFNINYQRTFDECYDDTIIQAAILYQFLPDK